MDKYIDNYLDSLEREIKEFYQNEAIKTLYIGGGTPSVLSARETHRLFNIIKNFNLEKLEEFTFEVNPEDINEETIQFLRKNKVNRISIGIQSFNKDKLVFLEREADYEDVFDKVRLIRSKGIYNINFDLMYGLPCENMNILKEDLKLFLSMKPTHISTYSLIIEDNTKLKIKNTEYIDQELDFKMYQYIIKTLTNNDYEHYEVSNFALEGKQSIHNQAYWNNKEYYGFGLGAAGYFNGFRYQNTPNIDNYINGDYRFQTELLSNQEIMEYEVILGLKKIKGINKQEFEQKYGVKLEDTFPIKPLLNNKDLIEKNGYIFINPQRIYLMNEILLKMV